ncbi:MAG: glycerol-3-phosphate acyltransferase [Anaerolineae bacterium]
MVLMRDAGVILLAYLIGSIPMGFLFAKLFKKIDIRKFGSGKIGGSNVLRAAGVGPGVLTFLADLGKGYGAVALATLLAPNEPLVAALAGLAAVVGHNWSLFLSFGGGVGSMTTVGAALALAPVAVVVAGVLALVSIAIWRYTSLGSLLLAVLLPIVYALGILFVDWPSYPLIFALGTSVMAVWKLRSNIRRLRAGTERKLGQYIPPGSADIAPKP